MNKAIANLLEHLAEARQVVVFSGAGLSADSGIPTFRDGVSGLWANVDPLEVASIDGFENDPEKVWAWHQAMRALFANSRPNAGHEEIAALAGRLPNARVTVITQNIDGLHQAAGSAEVIEIHGSALRVRCHQRCGFVARWPLGQPAPHRCPSCGAPVRPDVVWFGEALDETLLARAADTAFCADVFFSVGTSAVIQPAASLPLLAKDGGAVLVEVNPYATPFTEFADYSLRCGASQFFPALGQAITQSLGRPG
jgi:NAD-dependent deacetylase